MSKFHIVQKGMKVSVGQQIWQHRHYKEGTVQLIIYRGKNGNTDITRLAQCNEWFSLWNMVAPACAMIYPSKYGNPDIIRGACVRIYLSKYGNTDIIRGALWNDLPEQIWQHRDIIRGALSNDLPEQIRQTPTLSGVPCMINDLPDQIWQHRHYKGCPVQWFK